MAIRTDRRHYNAWYGLGSIYHRQEKYDMAEYHFRRALSINPQARWVMGRGTTGWDGMGWDGMGWFDEMGWDGMGWD